MSDGARAAEQAGARPIRWPVPSRAALRWSALAAIVTLAYFVVFATTREGGVARWTVYTLRSAVPLVLAAGATRAWLRAQVVGRSSRRQILSHAAGASAFPLGWFWLLTVMGGLLDGASPIDFAVKRFLWGPAAEWQLLQGLFAYGALAALVELEARPVPVAPTPAPAPEAVPAPPVRSARLLVRVGDEALALDPADVVAITGADDYAELVTRTARHLVGTTLTEFEAMLDPDRFLRVHRSAIVNLDRVVRVEPAGGGRVVLHLEAGATVQASRAGAKLVRDRLL